jgi:RsiW-degrading membrane proteinase PrsW (M82 family)
LTTTTPVTDDPGSHPSIRYQPGIFHPGLWDREGAGSWNSEAMWNAFFLGAVGGIGAVGCEFALQYLLPSGEMHPLVDAATTATLLAAIPEESIKFFVLVSMADKHVDARRLQDVLILALAVSLGFAALENCFYVISTGDWRVTAALRAITSFPGHGIDGFAMGALLIAARLNGDPGRKLWRVGYALLVPIALHAAYDFPLFAIGKNAEKLAMGIGWIVILVLSSLFVIILMSRILPKAVAADRASGRDGTSVETTDRLILGGTIGLIAGPLLAAAAFYVKGIDVASVATILSIFPVALGIDSILTGLKRKRARLGASQQEPRFAY